MNLQSGKPELLMPGGSLEKIQYAISYGADAVYFGVSDFSLRTFRKGDIITIDNLAETIHKVQAQGKQAYVTANIYAHNEDITNIIPMIELLEENKPNAIIFSDPGVFSLIKQYAPNVTTHLSTQANTCNYQAVRFWADLGVSRIILARELSLAEISHIHEKAPDVELESFVHGSLCVAYSGRCFMSDYVTNNERQANKGECSNVCRQSYTIVPDDRADELIEVIEDTHGTYIMNSNDLCLIRHLQELKDAGVCSFKVEGRGKSLYYAAIVAKCYREAIDAIETNKQLDYETLEFELRTAGQRDFSEGFALGKPDYDDYSFDRSSRSIKTTFIAAVENPEIADGQVTFITKNRLKIGDTIDWITPHYSASQKIEKIYKLVDNNWEEIEVAHPNFKIRLEVPDYNVDYTMGILRSKDDAPVLSQS